MMKNSKKWKVESGKWKVENRKRRLSEFLFFVLSICQIDKFSFSLKYFSRFKCFPLSAFHFPLVLCFLLTACGRDARSGNAKDGNLNSSAPATNANKSFNTFEKDLETLRTADFDYIFVFRRKDNQVLTGEDKKYLKANAPASTNRYLLSDEDRAVIAGSKNKFPPESLEALRSYFNVEDYSKPEAQIAPDANANLKTNTNGQ